MNHTYKDKNYCNTNFGLKKDFHHDSKIYDRPEHVLLYKKVRSVIAKTICFEDVNQVLVGLSGGVDSAMLLHLLSLYRDRDQGPKIMALHIHHGQRGEESDRDEQAARKIAELHQCHFDVIHLKIQPGMSEDELRNLRYQAFDSYAQEHKIERIALGHHMDDQAETFLFRLIRGADLRGLSAMKVFRPPFVRPLLFCSRDEIVREAEHCQIPYVEDSSNFQTGPARNFLRKVVIPALKAKMDPQIIQHLVDASLSLGEIEEELSSQVIEMIKETQVTPHVYSIAKLRKVAPVIRKKMIQMMFSYICKDKGCLSREHIEMINQWMETTQSPKYLLLPNNIRVDKNKGVLIFIKSQTEPCKISVK